MRLILMGTGPFAVPTFEALRQAGYEILHVVTRPIAASTSKKGPPPSPVRLWATEHELPIADPVSINDPSAVEWLRTLEGDLMVVCDYGQILSKSALAATRLGGINLHGSLLPRHRGAAPVQWSILSGDSVAGVSVIHMTPTLDGGPVLQQASTPIAQGENAMELEQRLSRLGVEPSLNSVCILTSLTDPSASVSLGQVQDRTQATKAPRLSKEDGQLNFHYSVDAIDRLIRGLQPWPGTYANLLLPDGKSLRVIIPQAVPLRATTPNTTLPPPGECLYGERLSSALSLVAVPYPSSPPFAMAITAVDGILAIPFIQPAGKRLMETEEFVRGYSRYPSMQVDGAASGHSLLNQL